MTSVIEKMAAQTFADHRMRREPSHSWRLGAPGIGLESFRVTWAPGIVVVSGDIGDITYRLWPAFGTLWDAIEMIHKAGYDYLTGKSPLKQEFDRAATMDRLVEIANEAVRFRDKWSIWEAIVEASDVPGSYLDETVRTEAVVALTDSLDEHQVYEICGDHEQIQLAYDQRTRWCYEAVQLWAGKMLAAEPAWHRLWRRARKDFGGLKRQWRDRVYRPKVITLAKPHNGITTWTRRQGKHGLYYAGISPFAIGRLDLSCIGLWRTNGNSTPSGGSLAKNHPEFAAAEAEAGAA